MIESEKIKYFDIQVNGYAGVDFNSMSLTGEQLHFACKKLAEDNVEGILATLITDDYDRMIFKIMKLTALIERDEYIKSIIQGLHVEGPFLNPEEGYRGAHPKEYIIASDLDKVKKMLDCSNGLVKLFTLAPEADIGFEVTKFLSENSIVVSAGHTNASMEQLLGGLDNGLKMFTHLGNGSPSILPRHDNIINRVLSLSDKLFICFIADGIHIPDYALKNYLKVVGTDRSIIVTDAMAAASAPPGRYAVSHIHVEVGDDRIVRELGKENLAGSAITMRESQKLLNSRLNLGEDQLSMLMSNNPKKAINII
jgi:N-acetylglucosamine-6-phosphate deacetylase